jgi:hypothetical protein
MSAPPGYRFSGKKFAKILNPGQIWVVVGHGAFPTGRHEKKMKKFFFIIKGAVGPLVAWATVLLGRRRLVGPRLKKRVPV